MRLFYWTLLVAISLLILLNIGASPILQHSQLPIHKILYVDRKATDDQFAIIVGAAFQWQLATSSLVSYDVIRLPAQNIDINKSIVIVMISPDFPNIITLDADGNNHLGYFERGNVDYIALVPDRIQNESLKTIVMHELGHSLYLKHSDIIDGIGTLMYPNIELGSNKITDTDLAAFCHIYGCDSNKLHDQ